MIRTITINEPFLHGTHADIRRAGLPIRIRFLLLHLSVIVLTGHQAHGQDENTYAVHANIIYHFTKYINWPEEKKSGDFVIGVTGNSAAYEGLKKNISDKTVGSQKILIKKFDPSAANFNCHILFIGDEESAYIKKIVAKTAGTSTLLVSESDGLAQKGSCINFMVVSDHLKLEINKTNIEQRRLEIASELLQLGKIVK